MNKTSIVKIDDKISILLDIFCSFGGLYMCITICFENGIDTKFMGWFCYTIAMLKLALIQSHK